MKDKCNINDKNKNCCTPSTSEPSSNLQAHWDKTYLSKPQEKLGWYEVDLSATLNLLAKASLKKDAHIFIVGAGSTTLVDELLALGYTNLTATDISQVALELLAKRVDNEGVSYIVDDLTNPTVLEDIEPVDFWLDRAVLHFFTEKKAQDTYFDLLKRKVKGGGFVLLAEFSLTGRTKCSGLPVRRYSIEMYEKHLGDQYQLITSFDYGYVKPSTGEVRPYVYGVFGKRVEGEMG